MNDKNSKKITYVVHYRNNKDKLIKTLNSILDQNIHNIYYDVLIIDDCASDHGRKLIDEYINKKSLVNFRIISLANYSGFAYLFDFVIRTKQIKTEYLTFLKPGDILNKGWMENFLEHLYPLKKDFYSHKVKVNNISYVVKESKDRTKGPELVKKEKQQIIGLTWLFWQKPVLDGTKAIKTLHLFLGKVFKLSVLEKVRVLPEKILFQDFYVYQKIVKTCRSFHYSSYLVGQTSFSPILKDKMTKDHIKLFCTTIENMIDPQQPVLNGFLIQMIALAIKQAPFEERINFIIDAYKDLNTFKLEKILGLKISKVETKQLTKLLLETGKVVKSADN